MPLREPGGLLHGHGARVPLRPYRNLNSFLSYTLQVISLATI